MVRRCFPVAKTVGSSPIAVDVFLVSRQNRSEMAEEELTRILEESNVIGTRFFGSETDYLIIRQ